MPRLDATWCVLVALALHLLGAALAATLVAASPRQAPFAVVSADAKLAAAIPIEFAFAYLIWRIAWRRELPAAGWFPFYCLQSSMLAALLLPLSCLAAWMLVGHAAWAMFLWPAYLVLAPALLSRRTLGARSGWRPVCPECGHSVAFARGQRCVECGEQYPSLRPFFRRWAVRRIPWERRQRTIPIAYLQNLLLILFTPWRAAWRLGTPDQVGRAMRWWLGHFVALVAVVSVFVFWLPAVFQWGWDDAKSLGWETLIRMGVPKPPSVLPATTWLGAWGIGLAAPVIFGVFLSLCMPRVQPALRIAMVKWSLYCGIVPLALPLAFFAYIIAQIGVPGSIMTFVDALELYVIHSRAAADFPILRVIAADTPFIGRSDSPRNHMGGAAAFRCFYGGSLRTASAGLHFYT